jgi:hypothetical protein
MEGFKKSDKMQCFKEGGSVQYKSRHSEKAEMSEDIAQDKKIVKKAFAMHDKQEHPGEKTNLSKLKKGGRAKKDCGTVKKYKTGGEVENAYTAKKTDKDMKDISNTKRQKPALLCGGKSVKKYDQGGNVVGQMMGGLKDKILGTPEQNAIARKQEADYLARKMAQKASGAKLGMGEEMAMGLAAMGQKLQPAAQAAPAGSTIPAGQKKGGKVKKMNTGGTCP